MKEVLVTERLKLTEWQAEDADFILKLVNTDGWLENIGDRKVYNLTDAKKYIKKLRLPYGSYGYGFYALRLRESNEIIGMCGIIKRMGLSDPDLGFALMPEHEGNGYIYEMSSAFIKHSFVKLGLTRVVAITTPSNTRSIKVLDRLGMKYEKDVQLPNDSEVLRQYAHERKS